MQGLISTAQVNRKSRSGQRRVAGEFMRILVLLAASSVMMWGCNQPQQSESVQQNLSSKKDEKFDLRCVGRSEIHSNEMGGVGQKPFSDLFRIDISNMLWCKGDCGETYSLDSAGRDEIVLYWSTDLSRKITINRLTGQYMDISNIGNGVRSQTIGTCDSEQFTGFPSRPMPKF